MRHYDNLKGKHLQYAKLDRTNNLIIFGLTREQYLAEKAAGNRDIFQGYGRGTIELQVARRGFLVWGNVSENSVSISLPGPRGIRPDLKPLPIWHR